MTEVIIYEWHQDTFVSSKRLRELNSTIDQIRSDGYQIHRINEICYMCASVKFDNDYDAVQFKLTYL